MKFNLKKAAVLSVAVTIVGLFSSIYALPPNIGAGCCLFLIIVVIALFIWLIIQRFSRRKQVPEVKKTRLKDIKIEPVGAYSLELASPDDLVWIADLEYELFKEDGIPREILKEWYDVNPSGFFVLKMMLSGIKYRIGHIDILPVRQGSFNLFCNGLIIEREIRGESVYSPKERNDIKDLYVESVIIDMPKSHYHRRYSALKFLLSQFVFIVKQIADPKKLEYVYAISVTDTGTHLMKDLGFEVFKNAKERRDGHNLYRVHFLTLAENIYHHVSTQLSDCNVVQELLRKAKKHKRRCRSR